MTSKLPTQAEVTTPLKSNPLVKERSLPPLTPHSTQHMKLYNSSLDLYFDSYHQLADDDPYWTKTKVDLDAIYIYDSDEDLSMYDDPPDLSRFDDPPGDLSPLFDLPSSLSSPRPSSLPNHPTREGLLDWQFRQGLLSYSDLIVHPDNTHSSQTSTFQGLSYPPLDSFMDLNACADEAGCCECLPDPIQASFPPPPPFTTGLPPPQPTASPPLSPFPHSSPPPTYPNPFLTPIRPRLLLPLSDLSSPVLKLKGSPFSSPLLLSLRKKIARRPPDHSTPKKNPGGNPFFQWTEESIDFPSMVRCSSWILMGKLNLIFSKRKNHFFIEIGWELKKLKNPYWEWIAVDLRQLHLIFFLLNLLSLEHF